MRAKFYEALGALTNTTAAQWSELVKQTGYRVDLNSYKASIVQLDAPNGQVIWSSDHPWRVTDPAECMEVLATAGLIPDEWLGSPTRRFAPYPPDAAIHELPRVSADYEAGLTQGYPMMRAAIRRMVVRCTQRGLTIHGASEAIVDAAYNDVVVQLAAGDWKILSPSRFVEYEERGMKPIGRALPLPRQTPENVIQCLHFGADAQNIALAEELAREVERRGVREDKWEDRDRTILWWFTNFTDTVPFRTWPECVDLSRTGYGLREVRDNELVMACPC